MISMLAYSHLKKELPVFKRKGVETLCRISEEDLDFTEHFDKEKLLEFLKSSPVIDISLVDVCADSGIDIAQSLRCDNQNMYIILLADMMTSPAKYIKPSILAGSLLLRPLNEEAIGSVFREAFCEYLRRFNGQQEESFVIDNREGRQLIPYSRITYFESRDKKIYINVGMREYSLYDTLDNLEGNLSSRFIRCHRSFIVNKDKIERIFLSKNYIELSDGDTVPLSRSYKKNFKDIK